MNKHFSKYHLILDFETMGNDVFKIPAMDCSFVAFDWDRFASDNPYSLIELVDLAINFKFKVKEQCEVHGASFTKRDVDWWLAQGPEAKKILNPSSKDVSTSVFIDAFVDYIKNKNIGYWWSRSNTFDPIILQKLATWNSKFDQICEHMSQFLVRDTRTFIDAKLNFPEINGFVPVADTAYWDRTFVKHDSRFDIAADILRLQAITRAENDLEMINT